MLLFVEKNNFAPPALPFVTNSPEDDGTVTGRFVDVPKTTLATLLRFVEDRSLITYAPGKRYRMTELLAEGNFRLVPDFPK